MEKKLGTSSLTFHCGNKCDRQLVWSAPMAPAEIQKLFGQSLKIWPSSKLAELSKALWVPWWFVGGSFLFVNRVRFSMIFRCSMTNAMRAVLLLLRDTTMCVLPLGNPKQWAETEIRQWPLLNGVAVAVTTQQSQHWCKFIDSRNDLHWKGIGALLQGWFFHFFQK